MKKLVLLSLVCLSAFGLLAQSRFPDPATGKWGYWDQEWNIIIPAIYDEVQPNFDTIMAVKKDGKMGACCGAEAKRLVLAMPKWTPGKKNGKPVRVEYTMPVRFKLE